MHPAAVWWWGAAIITFIYLCVALLALYLEYRKILRQRKIDRLIDRLIERAEDSGNESEGEVSALVEMGVEMGHHAPWDIDDL
nr:vpu protein [HIV-1 vector pMN4/LSDQgtu]